MSTIIVISTGLVMMLFFNSANAALISRTIVNDSVMNDWYGADMVYVLTGDISNNSGQFSTDPLDGTGDLDSLLTSTGRDLKKFSYTWDNTNIYLYIERWASSTNVTDWWFYLDFDANVTDFNIVMSGSMNASGGAFTIDYAVILE